MNPLDLLFYFQRNFITLNHEFDQLKQKHKTTIEEFSECRENFEHERNILCERLKKLTVIFRQCCINVGMPVSEMTIDTPELLLQELKYPSKHSAAKLNVIECLRLLGNGLEFFNQISHVKIRDLEKKFMSSRSEVVCHEFQVNELRHLVMKLQKALAGCKCRTDRCHSQLLQIDVDLLVKKLKRQPLTDAQQMDEQLHREMKTTISPSQHLMNLTAENQENDRGEASMELCSP